MPVSAPPRRSPMIAPPNLGMGDGTGLGSIFGSLMGHPLWGAIIGRIGSSLLERVFGPELPYGQYAEEQARAMSQILPELRTAAAGQPTAASAAIRAQVGTEGTRMQQAYATGARRRGLVGGLPGGTAPYAAQQGRVQAATQAEMMQRLGQYQISAQQTIAGLQPTAMQHLSLAQTADLAARDELMEALGRFGGQYAANRDNPQYQEMMEFLRNYFFQTTP